MPWPVGWDKHNVPRKKANRAPFFLAKMCLFQLSGLEEKEPEKIDCLFFRLIEPIWKAVETTDDRVRRFFGNGKLSDRTGSSALHPGGSS